ncbi:MAG TPA: beta-ketoacyl-[acyl-carrier-protein] synthase family protein [Flavipsychrobacter sp.]|nr:beta-ketoacyl-[acyl-carrier-protein] synthase family protein [Flavipsychrobacter sp.]
MAEKVVVTSIGIISALGIGKDAHVQALRNSKSGLRHPAYLQSVHAPEFVLGEVRQSNDDLAAMASLPVENNSCTRTTLLTLAGIKDLLKSVDLNLLQSEPFAFINANTVGGMCSVENIYMNIISEDTPEDNIKYIDKLDCAESTQYVAKHYGLKPFMATISTACSSSANALLLGSRLIKQGIVKRAICGGCDALSRFTLNGFNSLKNVSKQPCRPFDQNRVGLNLGEGAGYILLESESAAKARGANIIAEFSGYCNNNDAYHPTAPSPHGEGAHNAMKGALAMAGITPADIGYINTHGTATLNNDISEGEAMQQLFGNNVPYFSSTKPFTGHTLAAAGVIEAIFSIWALNEQIALPNLNFETPMQELYIKPTTSLIENTSMKHVLSNSFGFGGNNVSLVFSKS